MSTPLYDGLLSEVLAGAHVHRDRLATARAGIDRLHGPDHDDLCSTCRAPWPCATRRLIDGLARGDLDPSGAGALVDAELGAEPAAAAHQSELPMVLPEASTELEVAADAAPQADPAPRADAAARADTAPPHEVPPPDPAPTPAENAAGDRAPYPVEPTVAAVDPEAPVRPLPRMPGFAELLEGGRTSRALDVLLGRRHHG